MIWGGELVICFQITTAQNELTTQDRMICGGVMNFPEVISMYRLLSKRKEHIILKRPHLSVYNSNYRHFKSHSPKFTEVI